MPGTKPCAPLCHLCCPVAAVCLVVVECAGTACSCLQNSNSSLHFAAAGDVVEGIMQLVVDPLVQSAQVTTPPPRLPQPPLPPRLMGASSSPGFAPVLHADLSVMQKTHSHLVMT